MRSFPHIHLLPRSENHTSTSACSFTLTRCNNTLTGSVTRPSAYPPSRHCKPLILKFRSVEQVPWVCLHARKKPRKDAPNKSWRKGWRQLQRGHQQWKGWRQLQRAQKNLYQMMKARQAQCQLHMMLLELIELLSVNRI